MKTIFRIFLSDIKKIRTNLMAFAVSLLKVIIKIFLGLI